MRSKPHYRIRRLAAPALVSALGLLLLEPGCDQFRRQSRGTLDISVAPDSYASGAGRAAVDVEGPGQLTLAAAINETVSFELVLTAQQASVRRLAIRPTSLRGASGEIPLQAFTLYRVHEVEPGSVPGWHLRSVPPHQRRQKIADVLVPLGSPREALPSRLRRGDSVTIWVDVNVPKGVAPGAYTGRIQALGGGRTLATVDVNLTVWPFVLPDATDLTMFADVDNIGLFAHHVEDGGRPVAPDRNWFDHPAAPRFDDLLLSAARLLHAHKITPLFSRLTPDARVDSDHDVSIDWTDYDRVVEGILDGTSFFDRQPAALWQLPFDEEFPPAPEYGAMLSPTYSLVARKHLAACAEHFAARGWLDRAFVRLPSIGPGKPQSYEVIRHFGQIARGADERLQTLAVLFPQDMTAYGWDGFVWEDIGSFVDIWDCPAQFFDPSTLSGERMRGDSAFLKLGAPPFSGSVSLWARPADTRVIAWQAVQYDADGVDLGLANSWPPAGNRPVTPQQCCESSEAPLIYPGTFCGVGEPIPSTRLKRLRRSMQDAAYLHLMRTHGLQHIARTMMESLAPRAVAEAYDAHFADGRSGGWAVDPKLWEAGRQIMAEELVRATSGGGASGSDSAGDLANTVQWRRFMEETRPLEIQVEGVRVDPLGPAAAGSMEVSIAVTLANRTRTPVSGTVAFGELPLAWTAEPSQFPFEEIPPQRSRRVQLRATASVMETNAGAVRYLPLVVRTSDGREYPVSARMAYLPAQPLQKSLKIDGDLSDWPQAVGNVARDFVLITGEPSAQPQSALSRPTHDTLCFAAADHQALYFGFNCEIGKSVPRPSAQRNAADYESGVPVGDELVEILIAPENLGTRSPGDFYHVVVKPYGSFWERGIGTEPPVGAHSAWAADIRTATRVKGDRWVAEVRIPLDSFGARPDERQVLGLNITRFDLSTQEFSTWSGAVENAYDPLAAGNLALP